MTWDEALSRRYDAWAAGMTADVPFYAGLAREADGPLVEFAVRNGRVAIPVAQATGRRVLGIDTSPTMLEQARDRAAAAGVDLDAVGSNRIDIELDEGARTLLWWATRNEWLGLVDVAGLEIEALYGGFAGEPFDDDSREYVFVARR